METAEQIEKKRKSELKQQSEKLYTLLLERWEKYQHWQDFNERGCPSAGAMRVLRDKQKEINICHGIVNRIKKELGYSSNQIKIEDIRKVMNPDTERVKQLLL